MKTMSKSAKKFFAAVACMSMLLVCFVGCDHANGGKKKPTEQPKSAEKKILIFGFKKDVNPALSQDVTGIVGMIKVPVTDKDGKPVKDKDGKLVKKDKGVIFIKFPAGTAEATIKSLKPTFTASPKALLSIGNTKLEDSKTPADFYNLKDGINITVTAEDGSTEVYNVAVEIDLPTASKDEVQKYFGSYSGTIPGLGEVIIVLAWDKVTLYSKQMSMDYVNVEWEKKPDNTYTCTTYKMKKDQIKNLYGKGGYDFTEEGGKIMVKTNIMGTPTTAAKDAVDFVWTEASGYKPVSMHI